MEELDKLERIAGSLMALKATIERATGLRPVAVVLPPDVLPLATHLNGHEVVRGCKVGLAYGAAPAEDWESTPGLQPDGTGLGSRDHAGNY